MLQGHVKCRHIDGLGIIMNSCDAFILDEVPDDIVKLSTRIVKRWLSSYVLPYVTEAFRVDPEVRLLLPHYDIHELVVYFACPMMQGESSGRGAPQATDDATSPSSRAGDDRRLTQGDTKANQGAAGDQGDGAARDRPEGHKESVEGHGDEV
jgi:hypothetical protein